MRLFDPCRRKGHNWQPYGWSVMGFGPYRYHLICTRCSCTTMQEPDEEVDQEDGPKRD